MVRLSCQGPCAVAPGAAHAAQTSISPPQAAGCRRVAGASRQTSQRWPGMDVSVLGGCAPGSKAAVGMRRPLVSCRRSGSLMGLLIPSRPLDLWAVLFVLHLCLQRVHLRLHVEDAGF